MKHPSDLLSSS